MPTGRNPTKAQLLAFGAVASLLLGSVLFLTQLAFGFPLDSGNGGQQDLLPTSFEIDPSLPGGAIIEFQDCLGDGRVFARFVWSTEDFKGEEFFIEVLEPETKDLVIDRRTVNDATKLGGFEQETSYDFRITAPDQTLWAKGSFSTPTCATYVDGCAPSIPFLSHGPNVGDVTHESARIWIRTCQAWPFFIEYQAAGDVWGRLEEEGVTFEWTDPQRVSGETLKTQDNTGIITIEGLHADAGYFYRVYINDVLVPESAGGFKTMPPPGEPAVVTFAVGADIHDVRIPPVILNAIAEQSPLFALFLGDQIEVDSGLDLFDHFRAESSQDYEVVYRKVWANAEFRRFMARMPTFMMWDDHDIDDDWSTGKTGVWPLAKEAFDTYVGRLNPAPVRPDTLYYTFSAGGADFFVLDTRTFRSGNQKPDVVSKSMLGQRQKADLKAWLEESEAPFKFIASSVWWNGFEQQASKRFDAWDGFLMERNEIFKFIRDKEISGVVLLSGDAHASGVFRLAPWGLYEFSPTPLNVAPVREVPFDLQDPQVLYGIAETKAFGLFTVDTTVSPPVLAFELRDKEDEVLFEIELTPQGLNGTG